MTNEEIQLIVDKAIEISKTDKVIFCNDEEIDKKFRDTFDQYPHLFVLCCLMEKRINSDRAWKIPFTVCDVFKKYDIEELNNISAHKYQTLFKEKNLHCFNKSMATVFKSALNRIVTIYGGKASSIWEGRPSSATVVARFLEFHGCGIKIATMATNLLHRALSVDYSDYYSLDISPDVHIMRVMEKLGLIPRMNNGDRTLAIYRAREIYPQYPGILDGLFWNVGRNYCHPFAPSCQDCPISAVCKYNGEERV